MSKPLRFEYGKRKNKQFYWHLKAGNGEIIAQGEGYKRVAGVMKVFRILFYREPEPFPLLVDLDYKPVVAKKSKYGKCNRSWP